MIKRDAGDDHLGGSGDGIHLQNCGICQRLLAGHLLRHNKAMHTKLVVCVQGNGWEYQPKEENIR